MEQVTRDEHGRLLPGQSGNPSGRPKRDSVVRALAQGYAPEMLRHLVSIARDVKASPLSRVSACKELLDRAYGRSEVNIDMRLQAMKLENLLQGRFDQMSEADLQFFAEKWDQMQGKVIEHALDLKATESDDATSENHEPDNHN